MERDELLGIRVRPVGIDVHEERGERERRCGQSPSTCVELSLAGEVRDQERQHEQTRVPQQPRLVGRFACGQPCDLDRDGSAHGEGERLDPGAGRARRLVVAVAEELLPQPAAVLACVLPGQAVDVAQPLHGDQEPLVGREAGRAQLCDLVAKVVLELVDVRAVDPGCVDHVGPPLGDPRLEALHGHASPAVASMPPDPGQVSLNARVTAAHCRCWSESAARPSSVIA